MENSRFYELAIERINAERKRLDDFCEALDKDPKERKSKITEYKCARYRYAGLTNVWWALFHSHRTAERNAGNHYLDPSVNDVFITVPEYVVLYDNASEGEKRDYALYYGVIAFVELKIAEITAKLPCATDWEKIELEERMGGLQFAKGCLDEAWKKRKDGNQ